MASRKLSEIAKTIRSTRTPGSTRSPSTLSFPTAQLMTGCAKVGSCRVQPCAGFSASRRRNSPTTSLSTRHWRSNSRCSAGCRAAVPATQTSSAANNMAHCSTSRFRRVELKTCVFCELVAGKRSISVISETADVLTFMDIQPVNPGHALVIPKRHAPYLADLDPELAGQILATGMRVAAALRTCGVRCEGVNLFLADGEAAGQEIFHAHLHVFPRFAGDGFGLKFSPNYFVLPSRADLDAVAKDICSAMQASPGSNGNRRTGS